MSNIYANIHTNKDDLGYTLSVSVTMNGFTEKQQFTDLDWQSTLEIRDSLIRMYERRGCDVEANDPHEAVTATEEREQKEKEDVMQVFITIHPRNTSLEPKYYLFVAVGVFGSVLSSNRYRIDLDYDSLVQMKKTLVNYYERNGYRVFNPSLTRRHRNELGESFTGTM